MHVFTVEDPVVDDDLAQSGDPAGLDRIGDLEEQLLDALTAASIDGVEPEPEAISSGEYPVSRSLFFYVKNQHADSVPAMYPYVDLFMSEQMISPMGYLKGLGLIPLPEDAREQARSDVENRESLELSDLK